MKTASILKNCPWFSALGRDALVALGEIAAEKSYAAGRLIFSEGDDARALYIVASGDVDLVKLSRGGREQLVRKVGAHEMFAEAAMFAGDTYPATAIARTPSRLIVITKAGFLKLVRIHPEIATAIIGAMARLLRHLNAKLGAATLQSADKRFASLVERKHRETGRMEIRLDMPKRELARILGVTPETLSRTIARFRDQGIIAVRKRLLFIKDIKRLRASAGS